MDAHDAMNQHPAVVHLQRTVDEIDGVIDFGHQTTRFVRVIRDHEFVIVKRGRWGTVLSLDIGDAHNMGDV